MNNQQAADALNVLGLLLTEIRGIASQAIGAGHQPSGQVRFDPKSACRAISTLADAAHNLPEVIAGRAPDFLGQSSLKAVAAAGQQIYGDKSPFATVLPPV